MELRLRIRQESKEGSNFCPNSSILLVVRVVAFVTQSLEQNLVVVCEELLSWFAGWKASERDATRILSSNCVSVELVTCNIISATKRVHFVGH